MRMAALFRFIRFSFPAWRVCLATLVALCFATSPVQGQERPPALKALEKQGLVVVGPFQSPGGLSAWAGTMGPRPIAIYVAPDGKHVIAGTMLDTEGNDVNGATIERIVAQATGPNSWEQLEHAKWIADGSDKAPRKIYVFTDPNCPYCNKFWTESRPWVESGKVQLRHLIVGVLTETSPGKAAALLGDKNPSALLDAHERGQSVATMKAFAAGHIRMLGDETLKPLKRIPPSIQAQLESNVAMMMELNLRATPAVVWRDGHGRIQKSEGVPPNKLPEVLGPK